MMIVADNVVKVGDGDVVQLLLNLGVYFPKIIQWDPPQWPPAAAVVLIACGPCRTTKYPPRSHRPP